MDKPGAAEINDSNVGDQGEKRPYAPPRIISRERLESAANVCTGQGAKAQPGAPSPGGGSCGQVIIGS